VLDSDADPGRGSARLLGRPRDPVLPGSLVQTCAGRGPRWSEGGQLSVTEDSSPCPQRIWIQVRNRLPRGQLSRQRQRPLVPRANIIDKVATRSYIREMKTMGIRELKNRLSEVVRAVKAGEHILVTDRGTVVAELVPPGRPGTDPGVPP
jgi:prevent-host-death family protein